MVKRLISLLIAISILCSTSAVLAEADNETIGFAEYFTEENVIYNALKNNTEGVSFFNDTPSDELTTNFDVVLGFDISSDMYGFDYDDEREWLEKFELLSEQVPSNTRFAVVNNEEPMFTTDLHAEIGNLFTINYSGNCDVSDLLDECLNTFNNDSVDRNKIIITTATNVQDASELEEKMNELLDYGIIPFVFVLSEEKNAELDNLDYVYQCTTELDLRLAISDLYLSFNEYNSVSTLSAEVNMQSQEYAEYSSDFRERHLFCDANDEGTALISVLNAYTVLPVNATLNNKSYDLTQTNLSDTVFDANMLKSFLKGNSSILDTATNLNNFKNIWFEVYENKKETTNQEDIILKNLKRYFPVVAKVNGEMCIISSSNENGEYLTIAGDIISSLDEIESVFDTYEYFTEIALISKKVQTTALPSGTSFSLTKMYSVNYTTTDVEVMHNGTSVSSESVANKLYITADSGVDDDKTIIISANTEFDDNCIPKMYDPVQFYTIRLYRDVNSTHEWYYQYLLEATNLGIVHGDDENRFNPDNYVTRCEFIKLLLEAAQISVDDIQTKKWDNDHWALAYMNKAHELDILYWNDERDDEAIKEYFDESIPRYEAAYILKTLLIDKREYVQVPTLLHEFNGDIINYKEKDWNDNKKEQIDSYDDRVESAMYQMFMNDVFVGNEHGDLLLSEDIKRSAVVKVIIKPLFELDEDLPQIIANYVGNDTDENIVNLNVDSSGVELDDIVFDGTNKRQYTITLSDSDNKYYVGTYGGLSDGEAVALSVSKTENTQECELYGNKFEGHDAYWIKGAGTYNVEIQRTSNFNVGLKVKGINSAQNVYFNQESFDKNGNPNYYLFIDSPESLKKKDVLTIDDKTKTISCFKELTPGTYTVLAYHHKKRPEKENGVVIDKDPSSYLSVDDKLYYNAVFYGYNGTGNVRINKIGMTCRNEDSWENFYTSWEEFIDSKIYQDVSGELKNGNNIWLTDLNTMPENILISSNDDMGFVYLTMEFEVTEGTVNFATMAMANRYDFYNVFDPNQAKPTFEESSQMVKGKGNFGRIIESDTLEYYIDDSVETDSKLPFKIDSIIPNYGYTRYSFVTNASPLYHSAKHRTPRSSSLGLTYDTYYTSSEGEEKYQKLFFDAYHSPNTSLYTIPEVVRVGPYVDRTVWETNEQYDAEWFEALSDLNYNAYDDSLSTSVKSSAKIFEDFLGTSNMQGYGVTFRYNVVINNLGTIDRELVYHTVLNRRYYIKCIVNGIEQDVVDDMFLADGEYDGDLYTIDIPANSITNIIIESTELAGASALKESSFCIN